MLSSVRSELCQRDRTNTNRLRSIYQIGPMAHYELISFLRYITGSRACLELRYIDLIQVGRSAHMRSYLYSPDWLCLIESAMAGYNIRIGLVARICRSQLSQYDQFRQGRGSIPRFGTSFAFCLPIDSHASGVESSTCFAMEALL